MKYENPVTEHVVRYVKQTYDVEPEFLWKASDNAALRHKADKKWFAALLVHTPYQRLGIDRDGSVDVLDVKCNPLLIGSFVDGRSILPGYHMNKEHWISILLDGSVPMEKIIFLLDASYELTLKKKAPQKVKRSPHLQL